MFKPGLMAIQHSEKQETVWHMRANTSKSTSHIFSGVEILSSHLVHYIYFIEFPIAAMFVYAYCVHRALRYAATFTMFALPISQAELVKSMGKK